MLQTKFIDIGGRIWRQAAADVENDSIRVKSNCNKTAEQPKYR